MTRLDEIRELYAFNRWANNRVLDAVSVLAEDELRRDLRSSFPSIRDTLVPVLSAEWVWLSRLQGTSPVAMPGEWAGFGLRERRAEWERVGRNFDRLLSALNESKLDRVFSYRGTSGQEYTSTLSQVLRHCVNHSSYHRGQVTTMLRQLGASAPTTDLIHYYRTELPPVDAGWVRQGCRASYGALLRDRFETVTLWAARPSTGFRSPAPVSPCRGR